MNPATRALLASIEKHHAAFEQKITRLKRLVPSKDASVNERRQQLLQFYQIQQRILETQIREILQNM